MAETSEVPDIFDALRGRRKHTGQLTIKEFRSAFEALTPEEKQDMGTICAVLNEDSAYVWFTGSPLVIITVVSTHFLREDDFSLSGWPSPALDGTLSGPYRYKTFLLEELRSYWKYALTISICIALLSWTMIGTKAVQELAASVLNATAILFAVLVMFVSAGGLSKYSVAHQYKTFMINKYVATHAAVGILLLVIAISFLHRAGPASPEASQVHLPSYWIGVSLMCVATIAVGNCVLATITYYFDKTRGECLSLACAERLKALVNKELHTEAIATIERHDRASRS